MHRKVKIILNPMADMGNAWRVARDLRSITQQHGGVDWSGTVYPGHAIELAKQAGEQGYDMVIAMGGDGTVHEVVNGIMQVPEEQRPVLGVVPVGSGNDFAHAIGVSMKSEHALVHALEGQPAIVDLGLMTDENGNKEYFDNTLGIGFDTIVTIRSHRLPLLRGFLMYLTAAIETILLDHKPTHIKVETDTETLDDYMIMTTLCNGGREGGAFLFSPDSDMTDGIMEFLIARKVSRLMMFRLLIEFMKGTHRRFTKYIRMGACKKFSITADRPMYIHVDGEIYSGFETDIRKAIFEILPGALKVVRG